jgi:hypothetical protein
VDRREAMTPALAETRTADLNALGDDPHELTLDACPEAIIAAARLLAQPMINTAIAADEIGERFVIEVRYQCPAV